MLEEAEELAAWCVAIGAPRPLVAQLAGDLCAARRSDDEFEAARIAARVRDAATAILPRPSRRIGEARLIVPQEDDDGFLFENAHLTARVRRDGTIVELRRAAEPNFVTAAGVLRAHARREVRIKPQGSEIDDDALAVRYRVDRSTVVTRLALGEHDGFLRADAVAVWERRHTTLRLEHWLALETDMATFGAPDGTRIPGRRFGRVEDARGGFAFMIVDERGWNVRPLERGGIALAATLLARDDDAGEHRFAWACMPLPAGAPTSELENAWRAFAFPPRVRLFVSDDPAVLVIACAPTEGGDGVFVRVRECDGARRTMRVRCGGRAQSVEACETAERAATLENYAIVAELEAYEMRGFRVRFGAEEAPGPV
ncbi:MAG: hypothetical protein JO101_03100 [Candidatus Eremiobacteraeota bacterium]|nr:hypothetical protein [Candidatus Eremiobacteraeota bacterium]